MSNKGNHIPNDITNNDEIMMKKLFILAVLMLAVEQQQAQKHHGVYAIGFYNLENLFDYTHDEGRRMRTFSPQDATSGTRRNTNGN